MKGLSKLLKRRAPGPRVIQDAADAAERKYERFVSHARDCETCKRAAPDPESAPGRFLCFEGLAVRTSWEREEARHAALVEESASFPGETSTPRRRAL